MAGGVETQGDAVMQQSLAIRQSLQVDVLAQSRTQNSFTGCCRQVMLVTGSGMVAMGVSDDATLNRPPRVDVEIAGRAVQAFGTRDDKVHVAIQVEGLVS
ncbi:hypothetical protein D3C84_663360 [compost metagenome]